MWFPGNWRKVAPRAKQMPPAHTTWLLGIPGQGVGETTAASCLHAVDRDSGSRGHRRPERGRGGSRVDLQQGCSGRTGTEGAGGQAGPDMVGAAGSHEGRWQELVCWERRPTSHLPPV